MLYTKTHTYVRSPENRISAYLFANSRNNEAGT